MGRLHQVIHLKIGWGQGGVKHGQNECEFSITEGPNCAYSTTPILLYYILSLSQYPSYLASQGTVFAPKTL